MEIDHEGSRMIGLTLVSNRNLQSILMENVVVESRPEVETRAYFSPSVSWKVYDGGASIMIELCLER